MGYLFPILCIGLLATMTGCSGGDKPPADTGKKEQPVTGTSDAKGEPVAVIETNLGTIEFKLLPETATKTVESFIKLSKDKFYDGLIFHRIIEGFMIQGGDPAGNGSGGPGFTLPAEFNNLSHKAGTVSMARKGNDVNSAGSQFFICLEPQPHLDGQYTIFGQVVKGMDVVQKIGKAPTTGKDRPPFNKPLKDITMKKVVIRYD